MNGNYKVNGALDPASGLVLHTTDGPASACIQAGGSTSYTEALRQAKAELDRNGRPNIPDYIIFLTDGEANLGSVYGVNSTVYPPGGPEISSPVTPRSASCQRLQDKSTTSRFTASGTRSATKDMHGG